MKRAVLCLAGLALAFTIGALAPTAQATSPEVDWAALAANRSTLTADQLAAIPGSRRLDDGSVALAVRRPSPSWLTPELLAAAAKGPTQAPASTYPDLPATGFVGIRPGSMMVFPYICTMNFVFQKNGRLFIGTAGHCADKTGQHVTLLTVAPGGSIPVLVDIGTVVTRKFNEKVIAPDFAVVAIDPKYNDWVFPTIAQVGGPCGAYTGDGLVTAPVPVTVVKGQEEQVGLEQVAHYGHGLAIGTGGTPRTGVSLYWDSISYWWDSPLAPGDSGSAVRTTTLQAAGNLTDIVVYPDHPGAIAEGTRISAFLGAGYTLVNSPYCP